MATVFAGIILLIGTVGALVRAYRQARFYQIEEYKYGRYLRWWLGKRERYAPRRPMIAGALGAVLAAVLGEGGPFVPGLIGIGAALAIAVPPPLGEVKKAFRATPRARRLLGATFALIVALHGLALALIATRLDPDSRWGVLLALGVAWGMFLLAPLGLMAGNLLMTPVEAAFRWRFVRQARGRLHAISPVVIGITGSYGKTTTKNMIADILNGRYTAYATPKSYNTMMGVCIAINNDLADNYAVDYFVVEMGAYIPGEIRRICNLTPPQISVVVEVGPQHLERFGSLENIAKAKYEIINALPPDGVGVFNWDNPYVRGMCERGYPATRLTVSRQPVPDNAPPDTPRFVADNVSESLEGLRFRVTDRVTGAQADFSTAVLGIHNVTNILLATAIAVHEGMSLNEIAFRVRQLRPTESRLVRQTTPQGITIINDAYSANPSGIVSALRVLEHHTTGRRLLITPGMVELAHLHEPENRRLGELAAKVATDVILIGEEQTRPIKAGLDAAGFPPDRVQVIAALSQAVAWYQANLTAGDTVLFLNDLPDTY